MMSNNQENEDSIAVEAENKSPDQKLENTEMVMDINQSDVPPLVNEKKRMSPIEDHEYVESKEVKSREDGGIRIGSPQGKYRKLCSPRMRTMSPAEAQDEADEGIGRCDLFSSPLGNYEDVKKEDDTPGEEMDVDVVGSPMEDYHKLLTPRMTLVYPMRRVTASENISDLGIVPPVAELGITFNELLAISTPHDMREESSTEKQGVVWHLEGAETDGKKLGKLGFDYPEGPETNGVPLNNEEEMGRPIHISPDIPADSDIFAMDTLQPGEQVLQNKNNLVFITRLQYEVFGQSLVATMNESGKLTFSYEFKTSPEALEVWNQKMYFQVEPRFNWQTVKIYHSDGFIEIRADCFAVQPTQEYERYPGACEGPSTRIWY